MEAFKFQMLLMLAFFIIIWVGFNKSWLNSLAMASAMSYLTAIYFDHTLTVAKASKATVNVVNHNYNLGTADANNIND